MKSITMTLALMLATIFGAQAQLNLESGPKVEFEKEVHDFGELVQGDPAVYEFVFTNTGNEPLIISNSRGSCGCTVPSWPREPIAPGKSSTIRVKYDSNRVGPINKSVTITCNATNINNGSIVIRIKGNISPKPQNAAPVNNSGSMAPTN